MAIEITKSTYQPFEEKMKRSLDSLEERMSKVRAGRANPRLLDDVVVPYYGVNTPLNQVANITVPEARMIQIQPWDKNLIREIEKAILDANLGLTPNSDGEVVRLNFPPLTEERRHELTKQVQSMGEETKVTIRNVRREFIDMVKGYNKEGELGDDNLKDCENEIQKMTDRYTKMIDDQVSAKDKELMEF